MAALDHAMPIRRRTVLRLLGAAAIAPALPVRAEIGPLTRSVPSSGTALPLVGLGSWITFNVGDDPVARRQCTQVMDAFFQSGGRMIDSSPMYGSAQSVIGAGLKTLGHPPALFSADKVWTGSARKGPEQIEETRGRWGVPRFDLLQVHNLLAWEDHLPVLFAMKQAGALGHVGITTSEGRRYGEMEQVMRAQPLDFVQLTYNPVDREAEERLLPLAREKGIAVIVNRPFRQGDLTRALARKPVPDWAGEIGCATWAQIVLKYIVSHPAVTCAIPATTRVEHVRENMDAARGPLPDEALRRRIAAAVKDAA